MRTALEDSAFLRKSRHLSDESATTDASTCIGLHAAANGMDPPAFSATCALVGIGGLRCTGSFSPAEAHASRETLNTDAFR